MAVKCSFDKISWLKNYSTKITRKIVFRHYCDSCNSFYLNAEQCTENILLRLRLAA